MGAYKRDRSQGRCTGNISSTPPRTIPLHQTRVFRRLPRSRSHPSARAFKRSQHQPGRTPATPSTRHCRTAAPRPPRCHQRPHRHPNVASTSSPQRNTAAAISSCCACPRAKRSASENTRPKKFRRRDLRASHAYALQALQSERFSLRIESVRYSIREEPHHGSWRRLLGLFRTHRWLPWLVPRGCVG
jgi:hypothetical protein